MKKTQTYTCPECSREFNSAHSLVIHKTWHGRKKKAEAPTQAPETEPPADFGVDKTPPAAPLKMTMWRAVTEQDDSGVIGSATRLLSCLMEQKDPELRTMLIVEHITAGRKREAITMLMESAPVQSRVDERGTPSGAQAETEKLSGTGNSDLPDSSKPAKAQD